MKRDLRVLAAAGSLLLTLSMGPSAFAQKQGGILKLGHFDSPASMSMLEESTQAVNRPMSGVFNNLVMYKQDVLRAMIPMCRTTAQKRTGSWRSSATGQANGSPSRCRRETFSRTGMRRSS